MTSVPATHFSYPHNDCLLIIGTGVDRGGRQGAQPPPLNGRAKKKGRGYFYQMSNVYTCVAYLIEIRKFCSKKGVNFEAQNALKFTYKHI